MLLFHGMLLTIRKKYKILPALYFHIQCYFCVIIKVGEKKMKKKQGIATESNYASLVYLYSGEFGCKMELCNRQRLGQNAAQKAVSLWSDVSCIVHSCASLSLPSCYPSNILVADVPISSVFIAFFL